MRRVAMLAGLLALVAVAGGCGDKYDRAMQKSVSVMKRMCSVLADVQDEASAKEAKPKLQALADEFKGMQKIGDEMKTLPKERQDALKKKYEPKLTQAVSELMAEYKRIAGLKDADKIMAILAEVQPFK